MATNSSSNVTETELAMLQVLWERGEATRRQVTDSLYPGGGDSHYATVQKLLERLEKKGFVAHERREGVLVFWANVDREEFLRRRFQGLADDLTGGAIAPLLMTLVRSQALSSDDVETLYALLRERRRKKPSSDPS